MTGKEEITFLLKQVQEGLALVVPPPLTLLKDVDSLAHFINRRTYPININLCFYPKNNSGLTFIIITRLLLKLEIKVFTGFWTADFFFIGLGEDMGDKRPSIPFNDVLYGGCTTYPKEWRKPFLVVCFWSSSPNIP